MLSTWIAGAIGQGVVAGLAGTAAMTMSSTIEVRVRAGSPAQLWPGPPRRCLVVVGRWCSGSGLLGPESVHEYRYVALGELG
jgi:hypothetical protein